MKSGVAKNALPLLLFLLSLTPSYGRLGESYDDCVNRFGNADWESKKSLYTQPGDYFAEFQKDGFRIYVAFINGSVAHEEFRKLNNITITEENMQTLLHADSAGKTWATPYTDKYQRIIYIRDDGALAVSFMNSFTIETKEYAKLADNLSANDGKLKSF
jgi:hypothetical protein